MSIIDQFLEDMNRWKITLKQYEETVSAATKALDKLGVPALDSGGMLLSPAHRIELLAKKAGVPVVAEQADTTMTRDEAIKCLKAGKTVISVDCGAFSRYRMINGQLQYLNYRGQWTPCSYDALPNTHDYVLPLAKEEVVTCAALQSDR